ncbi:hypothetical protein NW762_012211 [Fusarium torreyae]|uniref:Uncharacterized protein n=1 Tax=Fusarium torreyae TaxID=1237075 RepID=A0A9W8RR80_9HYPO|nr:hypothetical protein NW762_012211 [Fusarium torreyae]
MSLYISWALQSAGLGRSAMIAAERLATLPPFNRNMIALDCVQKHFQLADNNFGKPPGYSGGTQTTERTTEEWYARQGYEVVQRVDRGYDWKDPLLEEVVPVPVVYMVKKLS